MSPKTTTHLVLDGLQEPRWALELSRRWSEAGLPNRLDVAGQYATLHPADDASPSQATAAPVLSESDVQRAVEIGREFGVVVHDRVGRGFVAENRLDSLRGHVAAQSRQRLAVALMFGLPVLVLHHTAPYLAGAGGTSSMVFPWLIEMVLTAWVCATAGWPILWNGAQALARLRPNGDVLTALLLSASFLVSLRQLTAVAAVNREALETVNVPIFHAGVMVLWLALAQRWLAQRAAGRLSGRGSWMLRGHARLVVAWCGATVLVGIFVGWRSAIGFGIVLPPAMSFGAVNRRAAGWSAALPVVGFAFFYCFGPDALNLDVDGIEVEIAALFGVLMTGVFAAGWHGMAPAGAK